MTSTLIRPLLSTPTTPSRQTTSTRAVMSPWVWMAVTCLLLGISGGVRLWRDWKFATLAGQSKASPFELAELPRSAGTWQAGDDSESQLDPEVARYAGASQHVVRGYLDEKSGEKAVALVLYGLATVVYPHTPDICYPCAGYKLVRGPVDYSITVPGVKNPVRYRWAIYGKRVGGIFRYEEAYHTFLHNGEWLPDTADRWKLFRYHPGLFKVQISRAVSGLNEDSDGPCKSLLAEIVRQVNDRLASTPAGETPSKD
jgi:hypothetical protein